MKVFRDYTSKEVRLTDERLAHILDHPEMADLFSAIERALRQPQLVRKSRTDAATRLFTDFSGKQSWVANGFALWLTA